jgi:hypothetical protein
MGFGAKRGQTARRTDADVDGILAAAVFYSF